MNYTAKSFQSFLLVVLLASTVIGCGGGDNSASTAASQPLPSASTQSSTGTGSSVPDVATKSVGATQTEADALADLAISQAKSLVTSTSATNVSSTASGATTSQAVAPNTKSAVNPGIGADSLVSKDSKTSIDSVAKVDALVSKVEQTVGSKAFNLDITSGLISSIIRNADIRAPYGGGHIDLQYVNAILGEKISVPFNVSVTGAGNTAASVNLNTVNADGTLGGTVSITVGGTTTKFNVVRAS